MLLCNPFSVTLEIFLATWALDFFKIFSLTCQGLTAVFLLFLGLYELLSFDLDVVSLVDGRLKVPVFLRDLRSILFLKEVFEGKRFLTGVLFWISSISKLRGSLNWASDPEIWFLNLLLWWFIIEEATLKTLELCLHLLDVDLFSSFAMALIEHSIHFPGYQLLLILVICVFFPILLTHLLMLLEYSFGYHFLTYGTLLQRRRYLGKRVISGLLTAVCPSMIFLLL